MKTYIWTLPTRIFHWLLAIGFTIAYILADFDNLKNFHFAFGAFVGALIFFRLLFGFFGPVYSNFKDFPLGFNSLKEFIKKNRSKIYPGHNPAAAVVMLFILIVGLLCGISGYLLYATENNVLSLSVDEDFLEESHEVLANLFLLLIGIHLLGMFRDALIHRKTGTLQSIFTGYKTIETKTATLNGFHKGFVVIWFVVSFYIFYWAYSLPIHTTDKEESQIENNEHFEHDDE